MKKSSKKIESYKEKIRKLVNYLDIVEYKNSAVGTAVYAEFKLANKIILKRHISNHKNDEKAMKKFCKQVLGILERKYDANHNFVLDIIKSLPGVLQLRNHPYISIIKIII